MRVSIVLCILPFLAACGTTRVVASPVAVEIEGAVQWQDIPADLLVFHQKTTIPEELTYGEAMQLWSADRGIIDTLLGQIEGISTLNNESQNQ
jgi:hypothetical protein